jgi:hypothetical protein
MTGYTLTLAHPADPADCLAESLLTLLHAPPWVAYLTFGDLYLSDVNDDPNLENEYETGLDLWAASVPTLFEALCRWSGGTPAWISRTRKAGLAELADKLVGSAVEDEWTIQSSPHIDPALVYSMTTYGWAPAMWTSLQDGDAAALSQRSITVPDLEPLVRGGDVPWWFTHGYKEPYLTGHIPSLSTAAMSGLVRKRVSVPVQVTEEPFVPHRIRQHRRWTADE